MGINGGGKKLTGVRHALTIACTCFDDCVHHLRGQIILVQMSKVCKVKVNVDLYSVLS